ncbi:serine hydrolase [Maricaulis sp.]|uniref:serine hydrolase domain-containing protein n=1 Tax=Maricaulis sp. TaxID=1486257 RepID=UPI001B072BB4|nr:serine hydrolase domain-containing protein [Maricaulis sp.]MBO6798561.1 beta-lactamase family protein [Maricaulis sp.]
MLITRTGAKWGRSCLLAVSIVFTSSAGMAMGQSATAFPELRDHVDREASAASGLGIGAAICTDTDVHFAAAGPAGPAGPSVDVSTRFLGGSIGKTFTAFIVAQLVIEGVLNLDEPVVAHFEDVPSFSRLPNHDRITLRQLLNHSAGVPDYLESWRFHLFARDLQRDLTPTDLLHYMVHSNASGEPGAHFAYSDSHYILAGLIVERVTGQRYTDLVEQRVIERFNLQQTQPQLGRRHDNLAVAVRPGIFRDRLSGEYGSLNRPLDYEWAAGGLVTSPEDLACFFQRLGGGEFPAELELMTSRPNPVNAAAGLHYGLGLFIRTDVEGNFTLSHGGDFYGFRSAASYSSRTDEGTAIQANRKEFDAPASLARWLRNR